LKGGGQLAWINNRWLDHDEREELFAVYDEYFREIIDSYGDDPTNWPSEAIERFPIYSRLERVRRCEGNLLEFAIEYFSEARNPGNDGNWEDFDLKSADEAAEFHREINEIMDEVSTKEKNAKIAVAAPRSHGKSTYLSKAYPIREVVYRLRKYIIIISETPDVSTGNMEWIRNQLKFNRKLREDFGPLLSPKDQANLRDNSKEFIAWISDETSVEYRKQIAMVQAASTGQALRGRNWNGSRPDLIILDDLEDARPGGNASTPEQRRALKDWFSQTVMPLGDPRGKRTAFVYMGTTVHYDSLLMDVLHRRSDFKTKIYRSIISMPERMDLWEQCRMIYQNRENPNRQKDAEKFYEQHREEMDRGVVVLWPESKPIWALLTWKWDNGSKAFNTEYQNNPIDEESQIFNPDNFDYHGGNIDYMSDAYDVSMGVDFALGREKGDYSAITVVARHKESDIIYVIDSWGERVKPTEFIQEIVERVMKYQPTVVAAEAVAAQEFFVDELKKALKAKGYPADTRVKKIYSRTRKELRIEAMLPDIESGRIKFDRSHSLLLEQFERYGQGGHDDAVDSLEMAISAVESNNVVVRTVRVPQRR
jgi:predicted phage terminase large subunit-like protein